MTELDADLLAGDVIRMAAARTWHELEAMCRSLDRRYEAATPGLRRVYEQLKTHHARRVAGALAT